MSYRTQYSLLSAVISDREADVRTLLKTHTPDPDMYIQATQRNYFRVLNALLEAGVPEKAHIKKCLLRAGLYMLPRTGVTYMHELGNRPIECRINSLN